MRIHQEILDCAIYFYEDEASAQAGKKAGASGFLFGRRIHGLREGEDACVLWAVTNRHVIEDGGWTIRLNCKDGSISTINTSPDEWLLAENDDIAIRSVALSARRHQFTYITEEYLLWDGDHKDYDLGPGDHCFIVGRFIHHDGTLRNTPSVRFGQIAQSPNELIEIGGHKQESYLVEIRSIGGYSGSPVFVHIDPTERRNYGPSAALNPPGRGPWLLGIDWCMLPTWERVCDNQGDELQNEWMVPANSGMMGVIPSWRLRALFDSPAVVAKQNEIVAAEAQREASYLKVVIKADK